MKKENGINSMKVLLLATTCLVLISGSIFSQCMKNMSGHNMEGMKHEEPTVTDSSVIQKGVIDLQAIDKNKDGKVFQDQMDWNVLSDTPGKCPLCGMKLKEVTLDKAKENLIQHSYRVKEVPISKE